MHLAFKQIGADAADRVQRDGALARPLEKTRLRLYLAQVVADVLVILGSFAIAAHVYVGDVLDDRTLLAAQVLIPLYLTIALYNATYSLQSLTDWKSSCLRMSGALVLSAGLLAFAFFYTKSSANFSRGTFTIGLILAAVAMIALRIGFVRGIVYRYGATVTNVLVIDDGGPPANIAHAYHVSASVHGLSPSLGNPHALDRLGRYMRNMDRIIVSSTPERHGEWSLVLKGSGLNGEVISELVEELGALGVRHYDASGLASLIVSTGALGIRARAAKRLLDIALSALGLLLLSPLIALIAFLIVMQDGGPVLFRQRRLGRGNRFFTMYKFRTMTTEGSDSDGRRSASRDDNRVTPIGRILRATSADELPQLFNVLRGDMSMVGPRPHAIGSQAGEKHFWEVDTRYWQRHSLKPGLTGLAQIRGYRGATDREADLQLRLQSDLEYLNGWSVWRDIRILFLTSRVLVHERAF